ncbi:MAG TPA: HK97 family phage prohead protease [Rhizobiales bacterium]|nr:HK97 family phage prohead protease [Hyphomicrobiales bacterium]
MTELVFAGRRLLARASQSRKQKGVFEGYASVFGAIDASGDQVLPGAFSASLARRGVANIRMLFQHDPAQPIGTWLNIRQDKKGLYVRGRLSMAVQRSIELESLLREGAIDGLSIGFKTIRARRDAKTGIRQLVTVDLWEISLVTFPMLTSARVATLKTQNALVSQTPATL